MYTIPNEIPGAQYTMTDSGSMELEVYTVLGVLFQNKKLQI